MGGQDSRGAEAFQPVQRVEVVPKRAVGVVKDGGAEAQDGVPGQHGTVGAVLGRWKQTESEVWPGVARTDFHPAAWMTSPSASGVPPWQCGGSAALTGAPVSSAKRSAPALWSACRCV